MPNKDKKTESKEYVLKMAKENDVRFIRMWFTDILGVLKSFAISIDELEGALEEGMGFDGSSIEGFARIDESDMVAKPDPDTFQILPWRPLEHNAVARMFCDILKPGGEPFEGDPRYVLKRNLKKAADMGFTFYVGPELEFFYFKDSKGTEFLDSGGYFDLTPTGCRYRPAAEHGNHCWKKWASVLSIPIMKLLPVSMKSICATQML